MAEEPTTPPAPSTTPPAGADAAKPVTGDLEAMKSALKKANKEAEQARLKLKDLEDAGKSELQKALDTAAAAEHRAAAAETALLRSRIARKHGLDDELMEFVSGTSEDDIEASAAKLAARITPPATAGAGEGEQQPVEPNPRPAATQRPTENLRGGGDPTEQPEETDPAKLAALVPRR